MLNKIIMAVLAILLTTSCIWPWSKRVHRPSETHHTHISGYSDVAPTEQSQLENTIGDRVFFAFNSSTIEPEYKELLEKQAEWMKSDTNMKIRIEGHTDDRGTQEYNIGLGERRAYAVKSHLVNLGISEHRIETVSYGKEKPAVEGTGESVWRENRRAVIVSY